MRTWKNQLSQLRNELFAAAKRLGVCACGVADAEFAQRIEPAAVEHLAGRLSRAFVVAVRLQDAVIDSLVDRPTPLYFHHYRQANYALDRIAFDLSSLLMERGHAAAAVPASQLVSLVPPLGHLSHRVLGWAAGIGWIGRSRLLVHPRFGARLRLATILTDAPLEPSGPLEMDCGDCADCIAACPALAIKSSSRDYDLDACYRKLEEFRRLPFIGQHICGLCVKACGGPRWTRRSP